MCVCVWPQLQSEVGKLYHQYRDESDARKVLLTEYNDLKYKQQEQKGEEVGATTEAEDPVVLKLKLMWETCTCLLMYDNVLHLCECYVQCVCVLWESITWMIRFDTIDMFFFFCIFHFRVIRSRFSHLSVFIPIRNIGIIVFDKH